MAEIERPVPRAGVMDIAAYIPGDAESPADRVFKLSSNETPLGPSPRAIEAFAAAGENLHLYPDGDCAVLRQAIAKYHGLNADRIVCGAGSDELLSLLAAIYLSEGDEAIHSEHGFLMYRISIQAAGAIPVVARETDLQADVDAILAALTERTKMVFLANPNNPTGTYVPFDEVKRLHAGLPGHVLLVLDAAYAEYVRRNDYESGMELASTQPNVVMTRTFSKIYGLAALRIGWVYGPGAVMDALNRVRGPFNVTAPAIAAGAAAMADPAHLDRAVAHNDQWTTWLQQSIEGLGLRVTPGVGNFLLIHFPDDGGRDAAAADRYLRERGLVLRRVAGYGLPGALRMTIGLEEPNRLAVDALGAFMAAGA